MHWVNTICLNSIENQIQLYLDLLSISVNVISFLPLWHNYFSVHESFKELLSLHPKWILPSIQMWSLYVVARSYEDLIMTKIRSVLLFILTEFGLGVRKNELISFNTLVKWSQLKKKRSLHSFDFANIKGVLTWPNFTLAKAIHNRVEWNVKNYTFYKGVVLNELTFFVNNTYLKSKQQLCIILYNIVRTYGNLGH